MKLTLLEMTQNILSSMDSDEVNSIFQTAESKQVAEVIRTAYFNIIARAKLPEHETIFHLDTLGDSTKPTLMRKPETVVEIDWIKYNIDEDGSTNYQYVPLVPLQQFLDRMHQLDPDADNVGTSFFHGDLEIFFENDSYPTCCTVVDDDHIIFNSYDVSVDTTLQSSKTVCSGKKVPLFHMSNAFVPDLDELQFPLLLNEAKSLAFLELKQTNHDQAIIESRRHWRNLQSTKKLDNPSEFDKLPNFGRR